MILDCRIKKKKIEWRNTFTPEKNVSNNICAPGVVRANYS